MSTLTSKTNSSPVSRRDAILDVFALIALPSLIGVLAGGCSDKQAASSQPAQPDPAGDNLQHARRILGDGLKRRGDPLYALLCAMPVEINDNRTNTHTGQLSGAHWDPGRRVVGVAKSMAETFDHIVVAVALGHELCHAEKDSRPISSFSRREQNTLEIRTHNAEYERVIPAVEMGLSEEERSDPRSARLIATMKLNCQFSMKTYETRRDIFLAFEEQDLQAIKRYLVSTPSVDDKTYQTLVTLNKAWNATQARRNRSRREQVMEIEELLGAIEEAARLETLQAPLDQSIKALPAWRRLCEEMKSLANEAQRLSQGG